uniref:Uncharacterized protein n=1 Tax=Anguilla anguilla TaxID=7936 RepID=A0A0E9P848_ANGAN
MSTQNDLSLIQRIEALTD